MSIRSAISDAISDNPEATSEDIAADVLRKARKDDLLPLVVAEVEHQRRGLARRYERSATIKRLGPLLATTQWTATEDINHRERLLGLMRQVWRLGDGTRVEIGQATLDEVRQRLGMLRKQHAGLAATIRVLESVEAELERTGARCLDDLLSTELAA